MILLLYRLVNDGFNNTDTFSFNNHSDTPTLVVSTLKPTMNPTVKPTEKPTEKPTMKPTVKPTVNPTNKPKRFLSLEQRKRNPSIHNWIYNMDNGFYKSWRYVRNDNSDEVTIQVPSDQYLLAICITAHVSYIISYHLIQ